MLAAAHSSVVVEHPAAAAAAAEDIAAGSKKCFDLPRELKLMGSPLEVVPAVEERKAFGHTLMIQGNPR